MGFWNALRRLAGHSHTPRYGRRRGRKTARQSRKPRGLRVEQFEQRLLLSIDPGLDESTLFQLQLDELVQQAANLNLYDTQLLEQTHDWIVGLAEGTSSTELAASLGADPLAQAPYLTNAYVWEFPTDLTAEAVSSLLAAATGVEFAFPLVPHLLQTWAIPNDTYFADQWHLLNTGQPGAPGVDANVATAWDTVRGNGVQIGIVDDALQWQHPDLTPNYVAALSFDFNNSDGDPSPEAGNTQDHHGTAVAGVAAARGFNGLGVSGVAPSAEIAGLRLTSYFGPPSTWPDDLKTAQALSYQNQTIDVYNNSWGYGAFLVPRSFDTLALAALRDGVLNGRGGLGNIYVFAAGNSLQEGGNVNYYSINSSRYVIPVAAVGHDGVQAWYSNPGAALLVSAPSNGGTPFAGIVTTDRTGDDGYNAAGTGDGDAFPDVDYTGQFGGTSSAAPLVAGVVALMLEANPNLTWRDVQHILVETARKNDPADPDWVQNAAGKWVNHKYGFGLVDATAAVNLARNWVNVAQEEVLASPTLQVNQPIPDNNATGISSVATLGTLVGSIEHVEVRVRIQHPAPDNLEIVLTAPSGTQSVLATSGGQLFLGDYSDWVFTSTRHWGESSAGDWTLTVRDRATGTTGTLQSWQITVYGTQGVAAAPKLVSVIPNAGAILEEGGVLQIAPRELLLRFNEGQSIDPATLAGIRFLRTGGDAQFEQDLVVDPNGIRWVPNPANTVRDVVVPIGYIGIGDRPNEVIVRFAENLPDDTYRLVIVGDDTISGIADSAPPLTNRLGIPFQFDAALGTGVDFAMGFDIDVGPQVVAVVPQPITRDPQTGALSQARNVIEVYFSEDPLDESAAENVNFYQVFVTKDSATPADDVVILPASVVYDAARHMAVLTFSQDLADYGTGAFRLRIGTPYQPIQTDFRVAPGDAGTSFYTAMDVRTLGGSVAPVFGNGTGPQSLIIAGSIDPLPLDFTLEWPGAIDEPGHRDLPNYPALAIEDHFGGESAPDGGAGVPTIPYYFPTGDWNLITEAQKQRAREIFALFSQYLGIQFYENPSGGLAVATGDLAIVGLQSAPGGVSGVAAGGLALMDYAEDWGASEFGGSWFVTAMHEVGHLLGFGHTYDLPPLTIMGQEVAVGLQMSSEPTFPGDHDILHGQHMYRPDVIDIDMYRVQLDERGLLRLEINAERMNQSSLLDAVITLYQEYEENGVTKYRVVARNDAYYSEDPALEMYLRPGTYYVGVTAAGNTEYDPENDDTGVGGTTQGDYQLRLTFTPKGVDPNDPETFRDTSATPAAIVDTKGTIFDGDYDGVPGGVYNYWFNVQTASADPAQNHTIIVDKAANPAVADGTLARPFTEIDQALAAARPGDIVRVVGNNFANDTPGRGIQAVPASQLQDSQTFSVSDGANTLVFEFDRIGTPAPGPNRIAIPYAGNETAEQMAIKIRDAISAAATAQNLAITVALHPADPRVVVVDGRTVVLILGNSALGNTLQDNLPYEIGRDSLDNPLPDGTRLEVPREVTLVFDAGAIVKLRGANVDVGSSAENIDRSGGVVQVLGIPDRPVSFTSYFDETLGTDREPQLTTTPREGDWGGLVFRNDLDNAFIENYDPASGFEARRVLETQGIFLNYVNHADIRYGGGEVVVNGVRSVYAPIHMLEARPTVTFNTITNSADAAMSGDPNSFAETKFENWDPYAPFTLGYDRVGPQIYGNLLAAAYAPSKTTAPQTFVNSINGVFVGIPTQPGVPLRKLEVPARLDDLDIVHVVAENLILQGTPGGPIGTPVTTSVSRIHDYLLQTPSGDGIQDAETFAIFDGSTRVVFEFNLESDYNARGAGSFVPGRVEIRYNRSNDPNPGDPADTAAQMAQKIADRINWARDNLGLDVTAVAVGDQIELHSTAPVWSLEGFGTREARIDARLRIDPGLIVKLTGSRIEAEMGAQLIAEGRPGSVEGAPGYKVVLTSLADTRYGAGGTFNTTEDTSGQGPAQGDWAGLVFAPTAEGSIDQAIIAYGGGTAPIEGAFARFSPIEVRQAHVRVANSRFEFNAAGFDGDRNGRGALRPATIFVRGAQPIIVGNDFLGNQGAVVSIDANALKAHSVPDWGRSTGPLSAFDQYADNVGPMVRANRFGQIDDLGLSNSINGMEVRPAILTTESIWDDVDIVHVLRGEIIVPNFHHVGGLRLQSSTAGSLVVKLSGPDAGFTAVGRPLEIDDRIGGIVQIVGQPGRPVVLTDLADDTAGAGFDIYGRPNSDTNGNGASQGTPGAWRSIRFDRYAHDRNVAVVDEAEPAAAGQQDLNSTPAASQRLGQLAPSEKAGDDVQRLGFDVYGFIRFDDPSDVDVYQFDAPAGTEIWIDIDRTTFALDTVVEVIDADGNVLARSDNSHEPDSHATKSDPDGALLGLGMDRDLFIRHDYYTTNPRDAGLRLVLPGPAGQLRTYYVRVRSALAIGNIGPGTAYAEGQQFTLADGQGRQVVFEFDSDGSYAPEAVPVAYQGLSANQVQQAILAAIATAQAAKGLAVTARAAGNNIALDGVHHDFQPGNTPLVRLSNTSGKYQMQIRLREMQEVAGCTVQYADIRYATNGIEVRGFPGHSPLLGETAESTANNDTFANAQDLGNLLTSDRNVISLAGYLSSRTDVDWYRVEIDYEAIQSVPGINDMGSIFSTIFDIDYADGMARPDLSLWVFDEQGRLIFMSRDSNIADDRPIPGVAGTELDDLNRGSLGSRDPYIGPAYLPEQNRVYYVAVTSVRATPQALSSVLGGSWSADREAYPLVRVEPINSIARVVEEHINTGPNSFITANNPNVTGAQRLSLVPDEFQLGDVTFYTLTGADLFTIDPFTGALETDVTDWGNPYLPGSPSITYRDIAMRNDGRLMTVSVGPGANYNPRYREFDTGNGSLLLDVDTGIDVIRRDPANPTALQADPNNSVRVEAMVHDYRNTGSRGRSVLIVGNIQNPDLGGGLTGVTSGHNLVWLLSSGGTAINHPRINDGTNASGQRLFSNIVPVGQLFSAPTILANPASQTNPIYQFTGGPQPRDFRDGHWFTVTSATSDSQEFEFDLGIDVRMSPQGASAFRDGQWFRLVDSINGQSYEFEFNSGPVIVLPASGTAALDGVVVTVSGFRPTGGNITVSFEFDYNNALNNSANVRVPFNLGDNGTLLANSLVREINGQSLLFTVVASASNNRVSLVNDDPNNPPTSNNPSQVQIQGNATVTPGRTPIPFEETWTSQQLGQQIETIVDASPSFVDASYAFRATDQANPQSPGDRLTFLNAQASSDFSGTAGNLTYVEGNPGVTVGRSRVPFGAGYTTAQMAQAIAQAINASGIGVFATVVGNTVELTGADSTNPVTLNNAPQLDWAGEGVGGDITGLAYLNLPGIGYRLFAVSDTGGLYYVTNETSATADGGSWGFRPVDPDGSFNYFTRVPGSGPQLHYIAQITHPVTGQPLQFSGLAAGPQNVEDGRFAQTLFASDRSGVVWALNTVGELLGIFADGATSIDPAGIGGVVGVDFSPIDYNLWHWTTRRGNDQGHGIYQALDSSRVPAEGYDALLEGQQSYYFGLDDPTDGDGNQTQPGANNFTTGQNSDGSRLFTYNMPGGAYGSLTSGTFSLKGYSAADKPTLYFTYYAATQNSADFDGLRVFVSNDGANWTLMATNTDLNDGSLIGPRIDDPGVAGTYIREIHDGGGVWRQARIDLSQFAGRDNLRVRFDFSTASDMDIGNLNTAGEYLTAPPAAELHDGDTFIIDGVTFEFDLGYALVLPNAAGVQIKEDPNAPYYGEYITISDGAQTRTFEFTKQGGIHPSSNVAVPITDSMTTRQVADRLAAAINAERAAGRLNVQAYVPPDPANPQAADNIFQGPNGNRVFLINAQSVIQGTHYAGAPLAVSIEGSQPGQVTLGNVPVYVRPDMPRLEVARAVTNAVNRQFRSLPDRIYIPPTMTAGNLQGTSFTITGLSALNVPTQVTFTFTPLPGSTVVSAQQVDIGLGGANTPALIASRIAAAVNLLNGSTGWQVTASSTPDGFVQLYGPQTLFNGLNPNATDPTNPAQSPLRATDPNETTIKLDEREDDSLGQAQPLMHVYVHAVTGPGPLFHSNQLQGDTTDKSYPYFNRYFDYRRGQQNSFEGWYIDDVIIGFAERGEMVTNAPAGVTGFDFAPEPQPTDPIVTVGSYQLEIRRGDEYGVLLTPPDSPYRVTRLFAQADTNDRWTQTLTLEMPAAANIGHGDRFWIDDGVKRQDFVFLDAQIGGATGNAIPVYFQSAQSAGTVANSVAAAINQAYAQGRLNVTAISIATSQRVDLWGAVSVGGTIGGQPLRRIVSGTVEAAADERFRLLPPAGNQLEHGQTFQIEDRSGNVVEFLYWHVSAGPEPPGVFAVRFDSSDSQWGITTLVTQAIQAAIAAGRLNVQFDTANAIPGTVALINVRSVSDMDYTTYFVTFPQPGETYFHADQAGNPLIGDRNAVREKGQIILLGNTIFDSAQWGIRVEPAQRDSWPHPGSGRTMNAPNQLVGGIAIVNNVVAYSGAGGILFSGDTNPAGQPVGAVPFGRIVNNTVYGPRGTNPAGVGIQVVNNASPTLLNNVLANLDTGIFVDASSAGQGTVIGGNAFSLTNRRNVGGSATTGSFAVLIPAGAPLFVNPDGGNFYPDHLSPIIDSSINSLQERQAYYNAVLQPIGIPPSPIVAPQFDVYGQLRMDDPAVASPPGLGANVFKDRGAIDRVDFVGPTGWLINPQDNDPAGVDRDRNLHDVMIAGKRFTDFTLQLRDAGGVGIDDRTVQAGNLVLLKDGVPLTEGLDYFFVYNATNDVITLYPAAGVWAHSTTYVIELLPGIRDLANNPIRPNRPDGSTKFTIVLSGVDFGDAPDPWEELASPTPGKYPTLLESNGARHIVAPGVYLGSGVNSEQNAKQNAQATGDQLDDGVDFLGNLGLLSDTFGSVKEIVVTASTDGVLDAWIDWNRDGDWDDAGEKLVFFDPQTQQVITTLGPGPNTLAFNVPDETQTMEGYTFARFRFSTTGLLSDGTPMAPTGEAGDGEVEDYRLKIIRFEEDFGDAPMYADEAHTESATTGSQAARHRIIPGFHLGADIDPELDGQPTSQADGDDSTLRDDEDGVDLSETFLVPSSPDPQVPLNVATVVVAVTGGWGQLDAWIDWNMDGDWLDADEKLAFINPMGGTVAPGVNTLSFEVPRGISTGTTYARFRLTTGSAAYPNFTPSPTGPASDGEVEDYKVQIVEQARDYGDAPEPTYPTTAAAGGAVHIRGAYEEAPGVFRSLALGNRVDFELDGRPTAAADGDDTDNIDDEDGITFVGGRIRAGQMNQIIVTTLTPGRSATDPRPVYLNGWIDFDGDGWADPEDHVFQDVEITSTSQTLDFFAPLVAGITRDTYARFRYSHTPGLDFAGPVVTDWTDPVQVGQVPDGEVEDYRVTLEVGTITISGYKFEDRNANGVWDQTVTSQGISIPWAGGGNSILGGTDDSTTAAIPLGFDFEFYGNRYNQVYVATNGIVSFGQPVATFLGSFPQPQPIIAPFWADVDTRGQGTITLATGVNPRGHRFLEVDWTAVGYFPRMTDKLNTFKLYIEDDPAGDVVAFRYDNLEWTDTSVGALVGFNGGAGQPYFILAQPRTPGELAQLQADGEYTFRFDPATGRPLGVEPGRAGVLIYLDANGDGVYDPATEAATRTRRDDPATPNVDETGYYEFTGLFAGQYIVREVVEDGWMQTAPNHLGSIQAVPGNWTPTPPPPPPAPPQGYLDGKVFTIRMSALPNAPSYTFEFDSNNQLTSPQNIRVPFTVGDSAATVAASIATAINGAKIPNLAARAVADLVVLAGRDRNIVYDPRTSPLTTRWPFAYGLTLADQQSVTDVHFGDYRVAHISVADAMVAEGHSGLTPVQVTIHVTESFGAPITLSYYTEDGTASAAQPDYVAVPQVPPTTITINPGGTPLGAWNLRQVTRKNTNEYDYSVWNNRIVWEEWTGSDWDIYYYEENTATGEAVTRKISGQSFDNRAAVVFGDHVVWSARPEGETDREIFHYDIPTGQITRLTQNDVDDNDPQVSDRFVAWWSSDSPRRQVYVYDLQNPQAGPQRVSLAAADNFAPLVSGSNVVWYGHDGVDSEIFLYDGSTTLQLTSDARDDRKPQVDGNYVVWEDFDGTDYEIALYDIAAGTTQLLTSNSNDDLEPHISGDNVVWQSLAGTQSSVYWLDLSLGTGAAPVNVSGGMFYAETPVVSGNRVVWHAYDGADWEVFYAELGTNQIPENVSNNTAFDAHPLVTPELVVWRSYEGGNYQVFRAVRGRPEMIATVTLSVVGDTLPEMDEDFLVHFRDDGSGFQVIDDATARVLILNDDGAMDYGDAPAPYPTLLADNGARHRQTTPGLYLGSRVDTETTVTTNLEATADDTRGTPNDEDGVTFGTLARGASATITVVASQAGYLDAWIDWDGDGTWEPAERIHPSRALPAGTTQLTVSVPAGARVGNTYARFRFSSSQVALEPTGTAADGEVEDYRVAIVDPVRLEGRTVIAQGGSGDDLFEFEPGPLHLVTLNGMVYKFAASLVDAIQFVGGGPGDHDRVILHGTPADETLELWPDRGTMSGTVDQAAYTLSATQMEQFEAESGGGNDVVTLHGTPGDDRFEAWSNRARLSNSGGLDLAVEGFAQVIARSDGFATTNDKAFLYGTIGDDTFSAAPGDSRLSGAGYSNRAVGFRMVTAISDGAGTDTAVFSDRAAESDSFSAWPTLAIMAGGNAYYNAAVLFDRVEATASGPTDVARLYDSSDAADTLILRPTSAEMSGQFRGQAYQAKASGFGRVDVVGSVAGAGTDSAELYGSSGDDVLSARPGDVTLSSNGFLARITGFESVTAKGEGGNDVARLYDSAGNDAFEAQPGSARMTSGSVVNTAESFRYVIAYAMAGGTADTAVLRGSAGNDTFVGEGPVGSAPAWASLAGAGNVYYVRAVGFDSVTAKGQGGIDTAILRDSDSSQPDVLTSRPDLGWAQMQVAALYLNRVENFANIYGFSQRGPAKDEAYLYGKAGADTLLAAPGDTILRGADYSSRVWGFEKVVAYGTDEPADTALITDSALADLLEADGDWVRLSAMNLDYIIEAHQFHRVRVRSVSDTDGDSESIGNFLHDLILEDW